MGFYLSLKNYKQDSGPRRVQSGPDHDDYTVLASGVQDTGADSGFAVAGPPLSGVLYSRPVGNTPAWRYIPYTTQTQSGTPNPTPYNTRTSAKDSYEGYKPVVGTTAAGASVKTGLGSDFGVVNPRGSAQFPRTGITRPEKYLYYNGNAPANQDYNPFNTPGANTAAEGVTGGGVTHRNYEGGMLTNVLGSLGTADRSEWRYNKPVGCKTYTETVRSDSPLLMSTPIRYTYRGGSSTYNYNYGSYLLSNVAGLIDTPIEQGLVPISCPAIQSSGDLAAPVVGDIFSIVDVDQADIVSALWYSTAGPEPIGEGFSYEIQGQDQSFQIFYRLVSVGGSSCTSGLSTTVREFDSSWFRFGYDNSNGADLGDVGPTYVMSDGTTFGVSNWSRFSGSLPQSYGPVVFKLNSDLTAAWITQYRTYDTDLFFPYQQYATVMVERDENTLAAFHIQKAIGGTFGVPPLRLYKFVVNKEDGVLLSTRCVEIYCQAGTNMGNADAYDVCMDDEGYYYIASNIPFRVASSTISNAAVMKLDEDLNILWLRQPYDFVYRPNNSNRCNPINEDPTFSTIRGVEFINGRIIFCCRFLSQTSNAVSSYLALNKDGTVARNYNAMFPPGATDDSVAAVVSRSVTEDSEGNVYVLGATSGSVRIGTFNSPIFLYKWVSGAVVWCYNVRGLFGECTVYAPSLAVVADKLFISATASSNFATGSTDTTTIYVVDPNTGSFEAAKQIDFSTSAAGSGTYSFTDVGDFVRTTANQSYHPEVVTVTSSVGFRYRFNVNHLPPSGRYELLGTPSNARYVVSDIPLDTPPPSGIVATGIVEFDLCSSPVVSETVTYSGVILVGSGIVPSGTLRFDRFANPGVY